MAPGKAETADLGLRGWIGTLGLKQIFFFNSVFKTLIKVDSYIKIIYIRLNPLF